jgi:hypothetical protein
MPVNKVAKQHRAVGGQKRRPLSRGFDPVVEAVGRLPATVHTKLLIAFVGTCVLLVAVGLLGLRVLGQSNDRVGSLGPLQERAVGYAELNQDAKHVRELLAANAGRAFSVGWPGAVPTNSGKKAMIPIDRAVADAADRIGPDTGSDVLGFTPPAGDLIALDSIRMKAGLLAALMQEIIKLDRRAPHGERLATLRPQAEALANDLRQEATT